MGLGVPVAFHRHQSAADAPLLTGLFRGQCREPFGTHLGVAGHTEKPGEPAQFLANLVYLLAAEDIPIRSQHTAQPPGRDAHLVHRVVGVGTDLGFGRQQPVHVLVESGAESGAGCGAHQVLRNLSVASTRWCVMPGSLAA